MYRKILVKSNRVVHTKTKTAIINRLLYKNNKCFTNNHVIGSRIRYFTSDEDADDDNNNNMETSPFPRLGWSPGSFGARALRKSKARKPGEATGRTKPKKTEEDYWMEAYEAYGVPSRENKREDSTEKDDDQ